MLVVGTDSARRERTEGPDNLTLGELITAFERDEYWNRVRLQFDKATFTNRMHEAREIRNKVMHLGPDKLPPENVNTLKEFGEILEKL